MFSYLTEKTTQCGAIRQEGMRANFQERFQHKSPPGHLRVGNLQIVTVNVAVADQQDVQIQGAFAPMAQALPARRQFQGLQGMQQGVGGEGVSMSATALT